MSKSPLTISWELNRNIAKRGRGDLEYNASNAQRKTTLRHKNKPKKERFTNEMKTLASELMKTLKYSPELVQIAEKKEMGEFVSSETVYKWIWECKHGNRRVNRKYIRLYLHLAHGCRRRKEDCAEIVVELFKIEYRLKTALLL